MVGFKKVVFGVSFLFLRATQKISSQKDHKVGGQSDLSMPPDILGPEETSTMTSLCSHFCEDNNSMKMMKQIPKKGAMGGGKTETERGTIICASQNPANHQKE